MTGILRRESFSIGQVIFKAGDVPRFAYLIQAGAVDITVERDGKPVLLGTLVAGKLLGEMALIDAKPRSAMATAKEPKTCVVISVIEFQRRLEASDPLVGSLVRSLSGKLRHADSG